jgi:hypothetical protein
MSQWKEKRETYLLYLHHTSITEGKVMCSNLGAMIINLTSRQCVSINAEITPLKDKPCQDIILQSHIYILEAWSPIHKASSKFFYEIGVVLSLASCIFLTKLVWPFETLMCTWEASDKSFGHAINKGGKKKRDGRTWEYQRQKVSSGSSRHTLKGKCALRLFLVVLVIKCSTQHIGLTTLIWEWVHVHMGKLNISNPYELNQMAKSATWSKPT